MQRQPGWDWGRGSTGLLGLVLFLVACTNDPYPSADSERRILYTTFAEAPKTLDPAIAYTTTAHAITGNIYEGLLEYHYLKRPYELIPALAEQVPSAEVTAEGHTVYRFRIRNGVLYQDDPCFAAQGTAGSTREVVAQDFAFEFARIADPAVGSPVVSNFSKIMGLRALTQKLGELREDPSFAALPVHEQYALAGGVEGVRVRSQHELEIVLDEPYPQLLYWLAMPFTAPVPWEAVEYYDGEEDRDHFRDHPVGTGPYMLATYEKQYRMILERNPNWYGVRHPEWDTPGAHYPDEGEASDAADGLLDPAYLGRPLPFIDRIEYRREKESIPRFGKFLQGYYDASGIIRESFDQIVREDQLSPEMSARGMRLVKSVAPSVYYLGFNMDDSVVGRSAEERGRKLRQAMSLVIDVREYTRLFMNNRGIPAQSPVPPGLYGYDEAYVNPYRRVDVERARELLVEAGYPGGIDPQTRRPLELTFDTPDTSSAGQLRYGFWVSAWRSIGLDVQIKATNYNQFQEKMRNGAYQLFQWGWVADYPDPENFMFLLESSQGRTASGGPNSANFSDEGFDALFEEMKNRPNDARRAETIAEMRALLEEERPWIELFHPEDYSLFHPWLKNVKPFGMSYPMTKYRDIDPAERERLRAEWNVPIVWPAYALAAITTLLVVPGIRTYLAERQ